MSRFSKTTSITALNSSRLPPLVHIVGELCTSRGVPAFLLGGVVRDLLLGRPIHDIDLGVEGNTRGLGRELSASLGGRFVLLDSTRDIVRIVVPVNGGGSVIDLSPIQDGIVSDLGRRDFTLDAMAVSIGDVLRPGHEPSVVDPHGGQSDLRAGVIRAVSPSVFREDGARLMRAPRLAAQLEFRIADDTAAAIRRDACLVNSVAPERVRDEFLKLLAEPSVTASLRRLDDLGLLCRILPELDEGRGVTQPKEHYWDVLGHGLEAAGQVERVLDDRSEDTGFAQQAVPRFEGMGEYFAAEAGDGHSRTTILKLAGLLHDLAKPETRTVEESGRIRFLGHHTRGAETSEKALKHLRFSGRSTDMVRWMVEHHLRPSQMAQEGEMPTPRAVYRYYRDVGDVAVDTLYLNLADFMAARGPELGQEEWQEHCRVINHILTTDASLRSPAISKGLISGHDIMDTFSLEPGPLIGTLLEMVREAQASGEITTREEALTMVEDRVRRKVRSA